MTAQRAFLAMGLAVAAFTGAMILLRHGTRPEALPFADRAPADTVLYVAVPEPAALADELERSAAWKRLGLEGVLARWRKAQAKLADVAAPSAAFVVRRNGSWAAFFRLRGRPEAASGEFEGLHWVADGTALAVSDTEAAAREALFGPAEPLELAQDRIEVCGASRAPFAWLDLRGVALPGRLADLGGISFTASFGESVEVRGLGVYYTRARPRILAEFAQQPRVEPAAPKAAFWTAQLESAPGLWASALERLSEGDRKLVAEELDRLAIEFLKRGRVEEEAIRRIGPAWGIAFVEAPHPAAVAYARVPEELQPLLRKACADLAKARRDRGLAPFVEAEGESLRVPGLPEGETIRPAYRLKGETLLVTTWAPLLEDPAWGAFASPPAGRWHVACGFTAEGVRRWLEDPRSFLDAPQARAVRDLLGRVPWLVSAEARGVWTDAGLRFEAALR